MTTVSDAPQSLDDILRQSWTLLVRGAADRRHGFHHPVVASIGINGVPKSRVVILRSADAAARTLRFHTDVRSQKWRELQQNPGVSLAFYDEGQRVQLRVEGKAALHTNDDLAREAWTKSQPMSRVCYAIMPGPGAAIDHEDDYELPTAALDAAFENFGAVVVDVMKMEWLYLKQARNRRALFDFTRNTAQWLVP